MADNRNLLLISMDIIHIMRWLYLLFIIEEHQTMHLLGIPETNLRGRNTLTARNVLKSKPDSGAASSVALDVNPSRKVIVL